MFFLGRNLDYALSLEGSLKLKEISYIHSEAYASGELKHGTISLIREGTPVIAVATYLPLLDKAVSNVVEVQARGARVLALTTEAGGEALHKRVDAVVTVPENSWPRGLPMQMAQSPTCRVSLSPRVTGSSFRSGACTMATSRFSS